MVNTMSHELSPGTRVWIPWGLGPQVAAEVDHVYGPPARRHVLLWLDPEFSGDIVDERVTISMPLDAVSRAAPSAPV